LILRQVSALLAYLDSLQAGPCPPGHYCPPGTATPVECVNGRVNVNAFGMNATACVPCAAGLMCISGDPVPEKCPPGFFCELGVLPQKCPMYTYNPYYGGTSNGSCLACPAGSLCAGTGISSLDRYGCPPGYYCLKVGVC
jgi:hypothetical protein